MALFRNRHQAGLALAQRLAGLALRDPLVLGIPRGGVVVAAAIADDMSWDLDVVLVRKLRAPFQPELAIGAARAHWAAYQGRRGDAGIEREESPMTTVRHVSGAKRKARAPSRVQDLLADATPVQQVMTAPAVTVPRGMSIESLAAFFLDQGLSGVPVVDADSRPLGVVTKTDILREWQDRGDVEEREPLRLRRGHAGQTEAQRRGVMEELQAGFHAERIARATAGEIMTPLTFTVPADAPVSRAAALMAFEGVHRLVVIDAAGKVAGIVSAIDVLRWTARRAGYVVPGRAQRQVERPASA